MSQTPSPGTPRHSTAVFANHYPQRPRRAGQGRRYILADRRRAGPGQAWPVLPMASPIDAATGDTLRRLIFLLNKMEPIHTGSLQGLRGLCMQLHDSQSAIDAACGPNAAAVCGFSLAAVAFVKRLRQALEGQQPALALRQLGDVEAICLGLCAFASVKAPSPLLANTDITEQARHALDGITASLLAVIERHGVDHLKYSEALVVHNWLSRACKARLLKQDSSCREQVKSFSTDVFETFSDHAVAAYHGSGITITGTEKKQ